MPSPIHVNKLGHLLYEVTDIDRSVHFWTELLGFTVTEQNSKGYTFLRCGSDHHSIGPVPVDKLSRPPVPEGLHNNHLALEISDLDALIAARDYLREHGVPIVFEGRHRTGNNCGFEFTDPDGYTFELYCWMDQIGPDGRTRPSELGHVTHTLEEARANPIPQVW